MMGLWKEIIGMGGRVDTVIWLNRHSIQLLSKYLCFYPEISATLCLDQGSSHVQKVMVWTMAAQ